jgi:flagellar M-ring protein FliF
MAQGASSSRVTNIWTNLTPGQRMVIIGTAGAIVAAIIIAGLVGSRAGYSALYSGLAPEEAGQVIERLDQRKIPYRLTGGGGTIMVPTRSVYSARIELASDGIPRSGTVGFEVFDKSVFGMTEFLQKVNYRRAIEGELSKTITQMEEAQAARVHIVVPERTLFRDAEKAATASVVIRINPAHKLSPKQVEGIAYLVASSVEGLEPEWVTILDSRGTLLSRGFPDHKGQPADRLEVIKSVETYLENKAQSLLDEVLGPGRSVVRVSADLNLERIDRNTESYDPESAVVISEERMESAEGESGGRTESSVTNYEFDRSIENIAAEVGNIERLSVALTIDGTYETETSAEGEVTKQFIPRSDEELGKLAGIVKSAVGFDTKRGDYFEVANMAFDRSFFEDEQDDLGSIMRMQFYFSLARKGAYLAGAIIALLIIVKLVKKSAAIIGAASRRTIDIRPGTYVNNQPGAGSDVQPGELNPQQVVAGIVNLTSKNPVGAAGVLRSMMGEGE